MGVEIAEAKENSRSQIEEFDVEYGEKRAGEEARVSRIVARNMKEENGIRLGRLKRWLERWKQSRKSKSKWGRSRKDKGGKGVNQSKSLKKAVDDEQNKEEVNNSKAEVVKRADEIHLLDEVKWAEEQWGQTELGDKRRTRRAVKMGAKMAQNPQGSIPEQMGNWAASKASYRLLNEDDVSLQKLNKEHWQQTKQKSAEAELCLLLNDITVIDTTKHPQTKNVEQVGTGSSKGFYLYSTLSYNPTTAELMGLVHQHTFVRTSLGRKRSKKWTHRSEEGLAWEKATAAIGVPAQAKQWVHVGDRGSDCFGFIRTCQPQKGLHFLIRLCKNRLLDWTDEDEQPADIDDQKHRKMMDYARSLAPQGSTYQVDIPATKKQAKRTATVQLAWSTVNVPPPYNAPNFIKKQGSISAWLIRAWELNPPDHIENPLEWVLLSSLPVTNWQQAHLRVQWYTQRWLIEEFFKVLKSGCNIERSQLDDRFDIERLLGFSTLIAVRLLQLRQTVRFAPDTLASFIASPLQIHLLAHHFKLNPDTLTAFQFWLAIARLGGFLNRRHDGSPGWITIWKGYRQLMLMTHGVQLSLSFKPPPA